MQEVLLDGQLEVQAAALKDHSNSPTDRERIARDAGVSHAGRTPLWSQQRTQDPEGCGLSPSIGTKQPGDLTLLNGEADAAQGGPVPIGKENVVQLDRGHHNLPMVRNRRRKGRYATELWSRRRAEKRVCSRATFKLNQRKPTPRTTLAIR
jgi:hypothetical protein